MGAKLVHGEGKSRLYNIWRHMRRRCYDSGDKDFPNYGGRGITFCEEWGSYLRFREWAVCNGYNDGLTIDRIDNNGNYEPSNCRWTTLTVQNNNRRNNVWLTYKGKSRTIAEWSRITGIKLKTMYSRYENGFSVEEIFEGKRWRKLRNGVI